MDINELKRQFKERDRVLRFLSKDGFFRGVVLKNSNMAIDAQIKHELDALPAYFLARTLSAATMISAFLKGEERVSIDIDGSGVISRIFAEAIQVGEARGFVHINDEIKEIQTVDDAIGFGKMRVSKVLYNKSEPVTGIIELVQGDIATDLAYYFRQSEQIPSAVLLDVSLDESGKIKHSAGMIIQAMPDAPLKQLVEITNKLYDMPLLTSFLEQGYSLDELLKQVVDFDFEIIKNAPVDFFCRCTKESFINKLLTLSKEEIQDMQHNGHNEVVCNYCNRKYLIEVTDFQRLLTEIQAQKN